MEINKEFAYFLGFCWADGYLWKSNPSRHYRVVLENVKKDLENILPILSKIGHYTKLSRKRNKHAKEMLRATFNNKNLYTFLSKNGFLDKLSPHDILKKIPTELKNYFWRGLFDGDGCVGYYKYPKSSSYVCVLTSHAKQDWTSLIEECNNLKIKYRVRVKILKNPHKIGKGKPFVGSRSYFHIVSLESIMKFKDFIYTGFETERIGFKRKFEAFSKMELKYKHERT